MLWTVRLSPEAEKQLSRPPRDIQQQIGSAIDQICRDPFQGNVKPLKGKVWKGRFRKRAGRYRLIFIPDYSNRMIEISQILARSDKDLPVAIDSVL